MAGNRPLWEGSLVVAGLNVPVRLFGVGESPSKVSFNHAHKCGKKRKTPTFTRLQQKKWCPTCVKELASSDVTRVFEHAKGQYLEVADADLAGCEPAPSTELRVTHVLDEPLNPLFIASTTYLVATGPASCEPFETVRLALGAKTAIADIVLQKRRRQVALTAWQGGFVVFLLSTFEQVRMLENYGTDSRSAATSKANVQRVREQLQEMEEPFNYKRLIDTYGQQVGRMLATKIEQHTRATLKTTLLKSA